MTDQKGQKGGAVSPDNPQGKPGAALTTPTATQATALQTSGDGDVSGPLALALSQEMQDQLLRELQDALHQVSEGFGDLAKPTDICDRGEAFYVVDAITIDDYLDKRKGEILTKHIFKLQFEDGRVALVMQSDARPRRTLAKQFTTARALGCSAIAGPYKYDKKAIPGQPQAALIMVQQPGFQAKAFMPGQPGQGALPA